MRCPQKLVALALLVGCACLAAGCSSRHATLSAYHAADITGVMPALSFRLIGPDGRAVTQALVRGKTTLLYFGYTHCPDECPTTLARVSAALKALGPAAASVRVLFVSVDPKRDTPAVLTQYAHYFAPQVIGLSGTDDELMDITRHYRVAYRRDPPDAQGNYAVYHSSALFVFDADGRARLLVSDSESPAQLAEDLSTLSAG